MNTANIENKDLPAFSCVGYDALGGGYQQDGLTKLEYFTAKAIQGLSANADWAKTMRTPDDWDEYIDRLSSGAVDIAVKALEKLEALNK